MKDFSILPNITIREAMKKLSQTGEKCLVIIDQNMTVLGTLSDGDLRKAILKGIDVNLHVDGIYQTKPVVQ